MKTKRFLATAAVGMFALFAASNASAALVNCADTPGAIANNTDPTLCATGDYSGNPSQQTGFMNNEFPGTFTFIGKSNDENVTVGDWVLNLTAGNDDWDFGFTVSSATHVGQVVDFVLLVKVGNNDHAYYWSGLTLNIDGFYNSFNINPNDPDFSHVSAFIRFRDAEVPEPGTLALLALGLLGVGFARRRATSR